MKGSLAGTGPRIEKEKTKEVLLCAATAGLVLAVYLVILGGAWLLYGKEHVFLIGDALVQYIHFIKLFFRQLFSGGSLDYSFEVGLGMPTRAIYAYYSLSPFNLVFLLVKDLDCAGSCLVAMKLMMSGAMFALLLRRTLKTGVVITLACSLAYAFCGYAMVFSYGYVLQDCLYLLPVLVLCVMGFVQNGKWQGLCLAYVLSFVIQFYCGYMISVFSVVILLALLWEKCGRKKELWKYYIIRYLGCVIIAVIISAPVTLPAALEIFGHMGKDATELKQLELKPWEFLAGLFPGHVEDAYNYIPFVYSGMPAVLLTILFFLNPQQDKKKKITLGVQLLFLGICTFFRPAYLLVHAFDAPDGYCYRFSWIYSFWMLYISALELRERTRDRSKRRAIIALVSVAGGYFIIYILLQLFSEEKYRILSVNNGIVCVILLAVYSLLFYQWEKQRRYRILFAVLLAIELIWNGNMVQAFNMKNITGDREYYRIWQEQAESAMDYIRSQEAAEPWAFYRVRNLNCLNDNISMLYGYRGLGYFSSIEHEVSRKVLEKLGYSTSVRVVQDYGSGPFTRMLFAQKYSLECGFWRGDQRGLYKLERNERVLPVAFMASEDILGFTPETNDPFANQNRLAEALTGEDGGVYELFDRGYTIDADGVEISASQEEFLLQRTKNGVGEVCYTFWPEEGRKLYAYISRYGESGNSASPVVFSDEDLGGMLGYSLMNMPHILPLTTDYDGSAHLYILMVENAEPVENYEAIYAAYEDEAGLERVYRTLAAGEMKVEEAAEDMIRGRVAVASDRTVLFTTIPYEKGWKAYVDGAETETLAVLDGAFVAVKLPAGEHEVVFRFVNASVLPAYLIGLLGVGLLLLFSKCFPGKPTVVDVEREDDP